jgi:aminocarboxymuconate-semialdehyde decarboxylase
LFVHPVDRTLDPRLARLKIGFGMGMPTETATAAAGLLVSGLLDQAPGLTLVLAHAGGTLPAALPRLATGQRVVAGVTEPAQLATSRARALWCDSLTYDVDSLLLAAARFGTDHIVLGTDYPFDAREIPAGAVLAGLASRADDGVLDGIRRANALALMSRLSRPSAATTSSGGS